MKKKIVLISIAAVIVVAIGVKLVINKHTIDKNKTTSSGTTEVMVNCTSVEFKEFGKTLDLTGVTASNKEVVLASEISGKITGVYFNQGDYVTQGQLMVSIDDRLQQLALESAKLSLQKAEDDYNKVKNLFEGKAAYETQLRDARIAKEAALIGVEQATRQLEKTKVYSAQSGNVTVKSIEQGGYLNVGQAIATVIEINQLKAVLSVSEQDVYKIKQGQAVNTSATVFPDENYSGRVTFISPQGDKSHNYTVEALIANKSNAQLKAGTFVKVKFEFGDKRRALVIPRTALVGSIKEKTVYVLAEDNTAKRKTISIGQDLGDYYEVLSGLSENEKVITSGQINLSDGNKVNVIK